MSNREIGILPYLHVYQNKELKIINNLFGAAYKLTKMSYSQAA